MDYFAKFETVGGQSDFDDLIASTGGHLIGRKYTLDTGVVRRGHLMGKVTSGGKVIISLSAAADGSQVPFGIAAHDADATDGDVELLVYTRGNFNDNKVIYGTAHTRETVREGLRDIGIYLETPVKRYP